jgi:hypothetical protein
MNILAAIDDRALFAPWFRDRSTWAAWLAFLAALFALPMTAEQLAIYRECTGRSEPPALAAPEAWLICGRRSGKSFVLALCAVFIAVFRDHRQYLAPGERATVLVIATDRKQARTIIRYIRALLTRIPMLASMVERQTAESFDLADQVTIEVGTASFRLTRGYTLCAALCDELAFWPSEDSAQPDYEVLDALRPGMATIPGAMLLCASSPYARRGALWDAWKRDYGRDGPRLVWKAPTRRMNPTVPQSVIDAAMERDPASAAAEYGAEFRTDREALLTREALDAVTVPGRYELPPVAGIRYFAWTDPSGGSADSWATSISHRDGDRVLIDAIREHRPPFSPDTVVEELAELLKTYSCMRVTGDRYGGEFPRDRFRAHGVTYELAEKTASDLFLEALPLINAGRVELLDHPRLNAQLVALERRTARSGKDTISHPPGGHDDVANAVAGALYLASAKRGTLVLNEHVMAWSKTPGPFSRNTFSRNNPTGAFQ